MSPVIHKTPWREQSYVRPRITREDIERARRDAEDAEKEERAAKWICVGLGAVLLTLVVLL